MRKEGMMDRVADRYGEGVQQKNKNCRVMKR